MAKTPYRPLAEKPCPNHNLSFTNGLLETQEYLAAEASSIIRPLTRKGKPEETEYSTSVCNRSVSTCVDHIQRISTG